MAGTLAVKVDTLSMLPPRHIAPAGTPIGLLNLAGAGFDQLLGRDTEAALSAAIRSRYGIRHCLAVSSGRAALTLILRTLSRLCGNSRRNEVIVPGYTCYSVAASAILAGLKLRIVDIDPDTLSYDRTQLENADFSRVLAMVSANLYGFPNELDYLESLARDRGVYMIDDAAQAMHAELHGRRVGTFGDVGLYSFDKGKNITSLQGGAIVTSDDAIAEALSAALQALPSESPKVTAASFIKLAVYAVLLHPSLYWIPAGIPALGLGKTVYTTDIPMHRMSRLAAGLVGRLFADIDAITDRRIGVAQRALQSISGNSLLVPITPIADSRPVYLRLPCLVHDSRMRNSIIDGLVRTGIGATASFPRALCDLDDIAGHFLVEGDSRNGARTVAERIVTLPTLAYLRDTDIRRLSQSLTSLNATG